MKSLAKQTLIALSVLATTLAANLSSADTPPWPHVKAIVEQHIQSLPDLKAHDIISRAQVQPIFEQLDTLGWLVPEAKEILGDTLSEDEFVVEQLRTEAGRRFMRELSTQKLFYDQLDRISREAGGKALIRHLIRLPDGEVFVRSNRAKTVPGMVELLPKQGSGKSRRVRDYDRPTGKIYTAEQLQERLQGVYEEKPKKSK